MAENESTAQYVAPSWRIETWYPDLEPGTKKALKIFHECLIKGTSTINLISVKTLAFADGIHFADCILAARVIHQDNPNINEIYDFGSGNGLPGLVYAAMFPKTKVFLVENDQKKCEFLKQTIAAMGVKNVEVIHRAIESLPDNSVQYCMARGLASISKAILMTRKPVKKGGVFYHIKGESWPAEVGEIPTQLCSIWAPALVGEYTLPVGQVKFSVVKTDKIA